MCGACPTGAPTNTRKAPFAGCSNPGGPTHKAAGNSGLTAARSGCRAWVRWHAGSRRWPVPVAGRACAPGNEMTVEVLRQLVGVRGRGWSPGHRTTEIVSSPGFLAVPHNPGNRDDYARRLGCRFDPRGRVEPGAESPELDPCQPEAPSQHTGV